jgi:hypothetical protein
MGLLFQIIADFCLAEWYGDRRRPSTTHRDAANHMRRARCIVKLSLCRWIHKPRLQAGKGKCGVKSVVDLQTAILTLTAGLISYIYITGKSDPDWRVVLIYLGACSVPWVSMFLMGRLRDGYPSRNLAFDRSTIMLRRCLLILCVFLVGGVVLAWEAKVLGPVLQPLRLPIVRVQIEGAEKIVAHASFSPSTYNLNPPPTLVIAAILKDRNVDGVCIGDCWEITHMYPFVGGTESTTPASGGRGPATATTKRTLLENIDVTKHYTIKILLHRKNAAIVADRMKSLIESDGSVESSIMDVTAYYEKESSQHPSSGGAPTTQAAK